MNKQTASRFWATVKELTLATLWVSEMCLKCYRAGSDPQELPSCLVVEANDAMARQARALRIYLELYPDASLDIGAYLSAAPSDLIGLIGACENAKADWFCACPDEAKRTAFFQGIYFADIRNKQSGEDRHV